MIMKVTIGGDRLGSGNKLKTNLNNYQRSTHDLGQKWTSSMTTGALYPFLVIPAMRGDKFTIDLEAAARTIPTQGPLYGSFKMQLDVFQCPFRLYQAILHNNPLKIGLNMSHVLLPQIKCYTTARKSDHYTPQKFSSSCLMKYLGVSGLGRYQVTEGDLDTKEIARNFNAIPLLAYYDIFKTYYSNKQEENAYVIAPETIAEQATFTKWTDAAGNARDPFSHQYITDNDPAITITGVIHFDKKVTAYDFFNSFQFIISGINSNGEYDGEFVDELDDIEHYIGGVELYTQIGNEPLDLTNDDELLNIKQDFFIYKITADFPSLVSILQGGQETPTALEFGLASASQSIDAANRSTELKLRPFALENIDDMRLALLSHNNLGTAFTIDANETGTYGIWGSESGSDQSGLPYIVNGTKNGEGNITTNSFALNGLMVKTYQSDIFNCWVNTEWIDGENGIAAITAVSTSEGKFTMDSLNLAEKLYDMLNRIAVSDGTYQSWEDTVYTESPRRHIESPIYLGGMSNEVVFEEIVQTTPTETEPLGNMGGRGVLVKRKGGHVTVNVDEASFIIGIVSLTPRINYTQGNEFYMTELKSMDDLHKPALDGIGFQNLISERLAWFGTGITGTQEASLRKEVVGKVPAWLEYMTAVDKAYGDFAEGEGKSFMVLNRNYEHDNRGGISDCSTYIDPTKFNYAFAYKNLDAQNFWVQIKSNIKARRLISAKQIPNL